MSVKEAIPKILDKKIAECITDEWNDCLRNAISNRVIRAFACFLWVSVFRKITDKFTLRLK